jgi:flagellar hook-basal body complex protein FliE
MIAPIGASPGLVAPSFEPLAAGGPAPTGFAAALEKAVSQVDDKVAAGDDALVALASGQEVDLHGSMIALEEADIALHALVAVRDRVIGAYEQLLNLAI